MTGGEVVFVGAGPGAADLITVRGAQVIASADIVIWASSLVDAAIVAKDVYKRQTRPRPLAKPGTR